jgi:hypothetical protein
MSYVQDKVSRTCRICEKLIELDERMIDLFRRSFGKPNEKYDVCWVHEKCARAALEKFLVKKWEREEALAEQGKAAK